MADVIPVAGISKCRHVDTKVSDGGANLQTLNKETKGAHHETTTSLCPIHDIANDFVCINCNMTACRTCMMNNNDSESQSSEETHEVIDVDTIYQEQKKYVEDLFGRFLKEVDRCEQSVRALETQQQNIGNELKIQEDDTDKEAEKSIVKKEDAREITDLTEEEQASTRTTRLQNQIQEIKNIANTIRTVIGTTLTPEYATKYAELLSTADSNSDKDTRPRYLSINDSCDSLQVRKLKCELIQEFGDFEGANNLAVTQSGLLVVSDRKANSVFIFNRQSNGQYTRKCCLELSSKNTRNDPWDVAVTVEGKCLVARQTHVEVYSTSGKYEGTLDFRQEGEENENACAHKINVMPDGRILVADVATSILTIISPDDKTILGTIQTSVSPFRMAVMSHGLIAVSYWLKGNICVVDLESREVNTLDIPEAYGLCNHEDTDCLLVGKCVQSADDGYDTIGTGVIEQYCSTTGRLVGRLAEGLYGPEDLTILPGGMLAVADWKTVKIYKLTCP